MSVSVFPLQRWITLSSLVVSWFVAWCSTAEPVLAPIPDLTIQEDSGVHEVPLTLNPLPFPASAFRFEVSADNPDLLPPGSLILVGVSPTPALRLQSAPDASGEALISVVASANQGPTLTNQFRLIVLPVDDAPRIDPIPNQVFIDGFSPAVVPINASDPDSQLGLAASINDPFRTVSVSIQNQNSRPVLVFNYSSQLISPTRSLVTLTASSRELTTSINFFVSIRPRELVPNGRSQSPPRWDFLPGLQSNASRGFTWADINRDGYPDLTSFGMGVLALNPRTGSQSLTVPIGRGASAALRGVVWGDLDNDGDLDAFSYGTAGFSLLRTTVHGTSVVLTVITNSLPTLTVGGAAWADLDGNGSLDLVYSGITNNFRGVVTALNDGSGTVTPTPNFLPAVMGPVVAADFDQDGRTDLLLCDSSHVDFAPQIFFNRGSGVYLPGPVVGEKVRVTAAGMTDANGDGIPDVWLVESLTLNPRNVRLKVFGQQSGRFVEIFRLPAEEFAATGEPVWGDFDHDGRIDFVAPYQERVRLMSGAEVTTNYFAIYHNSAHGTFSIGTPLFPAHADLVPAAADVDLDGDLDLVGRDQQSFRLFYNQQSEVNVPPEAPTGLRGFALGENLFLFWSSAVDQNQTTPLTYNVRVGTRPGATDLVPSLSLTNGLRMLPTFGNAGFMQSFYLRDLPGDLERVYWSVQAVDASFSGGPFGAEQQLIVAIPGNKPPTLATPTEFSLPEDTPRDLLLEVADDRTPTHLITVRVEHNTPQLFSAQGLSVAFERDDPSGARRRVSLRPLSDASGVATISVIATDRNGDSATNRVRVLVLPENDQPLITTEADSLHFIGSRISGTVTVADLETPADELQISAYSSNGTLLPQENIVIRGQGSERTIEATPADLSPGSTLVTLTVEDGAGLTAQASLNLVWQEQILKPLRIESGVTNLLLARWIDFDADGWLDVVGFDRGIGNAVVIWRQSAPGQFALSTTFFTGFEPQTLVAADFDGDGDVDLVVSARVEWVATGKPSLVFLRNDSGQLGPSEILHNDVYLPFVVALDADGDGDTDLVAAESGTLLWLWRQGSVGTESPGLLASEPFPLFDPQALTRGLNEPSYATGLMVGDFDDDGLEDLLLLRTGSVGLAARRILRQLEDGRYGVLSTTWGASAALLDWRDFNNDGRNEALVFDAQYGEGYPYRVLFGDGLTPLPVFSSTTGLGDLDGDGFDDVLAHLKIQEGGFKLLSALGASPLRRIPQPSELQTFASFSGGDFDRNGRLDLIGLGTLGCAIIQNLGISSNQPPSIPRALRTRQVGQGRVELAWASSSDPEQSDGLTFNVRVGTLPGANDVISALASPEGSALIPNRGNVGARRNCVLAQLGIGRTYYWSVQAVDTGLARSAFAPEVSFTVTEVPEISALPDLTLTTNAGPQEISFTISDRETSATELQVSVWSSNPVIFPASRISLTGDSANRVLHLDPKPGRAGVATITVRVTDADLNLTERAFTVYVPSGKNFAVEPVWTLTAPAAGEVAIALNQFDPEGDFREYQIARFPQHGTVSGEAPNLVYRPAPGFLGEDQIEFLASTPGSWSARGHVTLNVVPAHWLNPEAHWVTFGLPRRHQIVFQGRQGSKVRLEHSRDLISWESLGDREFAANETFVVEPDLNDLLTHFYRTVRLD